MKLKPINGVLEEVYLNKKEKLKDQLLLRPFPQGDKGKEQWNTYRKDMISYVGVSIFIFGNKLLNDKIELADGVRKEFEISLEQNAIVIPIGATGFIANDLWNEVLENYEKYFSSDDFIDLFRELGNENHTPNQLIKLTIEFLNKIINK